MPKIRVAPSVGKLERTFEEAWDLETYEAEKDLNEDTVFAGLYGLPDFYSLWRHKGKKYIFWCGSDIRHFINGYWLDEEGKIKILPHGFSEWINKNCENWVENYSEAKALQEVGIESKICPSFLGDINNFNISYKQSDRPKVYTSVSGNDFELYGWDKIDDLAKKYRHIEFHLYGNAIRWESYFINVIVHGRVSKEQMNEEIKNMQGALRLIPMEGFSEIIAKSVLMGQWPVSLIDYPHVLSIKDLDILQEKKEPNIEGRNYYFNRLNKFPWNVENN